MPSASGSSKNRKGKDKGKKGSKKGSKASSETTSETRPSPAASPSLDPQQQMATEPESLPPLPESGESTPSAMVPDVDQQGLLSPKELDLSSSYQAYVEDGKSEKSDMELFEEVLSSPKPADSSEPLATADEPSPTADEPLTTAPEPLVNHWNGEFESEDDDDDDQAGERAKEATEAPDKATDDVNHHIFDDFENDNTEEPEQDHFNSSENPSYPPAPPPQSPPIPLPSPRLTDSRSAASPSPERRRSWERHRSHSGSPALVAYSPPVYPYTTSPRASPYIPYMLPPNGAASPEVMAATVAPSIAGYAGAHRSPGMAPANVIPHPSYMRHVSHYGYPQRSMSLMSGRDYGTHSRTNSPRANGHVIENGHADSDDHSHDPVRLLQRIEKVMPDLSRLLHSYKDTQSKLVSREAEAQQIQAQHDQTLMQRDFYIEALQGQIKKSANENAEEFSKLRKKIDDHRQGLDNLQEKHKDIEENLKTSRRENEELVQSKIQLEEEISKLQDKIQSREQELQELHERDLEELKEDQKASRTAEKEDLTNLFEEIRNEEERTAAEKLEAREKELLDQQESLRAEWEAQKRQLEEAHTALQLEYDTKLSDKQAELDSKIEALTSVEAQLESKQTELESKVAELESKQSELDTAQTELESKRAVLESKVVELAAMQDKLDSTQTELEMKRAEVESKQQELESTHAQLSEKQSALEAMERELEEMRQEHATEFEETRQRHASALEEAHQNHTKELQDAHQDHASQLEEARENHGKELQDVHQNHASQLEETRQGHARELGDAHQNHASEIDGVRQSHANELETLNNTHQNELESLRGSHSAELEGLHATHTSALDGLRDTHAQEVDAAVKDAVERLQATVAEHEQRERSWDTTRAELERQLSEKTDDLESLEREKEALERDDLAREKTLLTAVDDMRRTIDNMENDREKLRKTLQSLGEATDLKSSKGDQFFLESFGQLSQLIVDLSKEHFAYLPIDPPKDILEKIPPEMPSFLDNTPASCELRAAYVQHVVSKTLTYRIFQPFLFTLGRRYDKADTFFHVLSMDIRRKSVRREAFWRQQTLKAAYTTSDAKQSINVVAAVIVDEIVDHIRHFADPKKLDALIQAVRKVVKLAAETWRHARVERELVLATMPAPVADKVSNDEWKEYTCDRSVVAHENGESARHVLLRLFPRIYREAAHEDFADDKEKVNPCVYSPGMVIYSDSPSVLARRDELARRATDSGIEVNGIEAHE